MTWTPPLTRLCNLLKVSSSLCPLWPLEFDSVPTYHCHYTFLDLDHQDKGYFIEPHIWNEVGAATATCRATILAAFGASVPNIATKWSQMSAEMYANWRLYIALIVLHGRFKSPQYHQHFMQLVKLLKLCLAFEILESMLNQIDWGLQLWVEEYRK